MIERYWNIKIKKGRLSDFKIQIRYKSNSKLHQIQFLISMIFYKAIR